MTFQPVMPMAAFQGAALAAEPYFRSTTIV
jgi:hypothetical protein